jgi:hypothetical protein
MVYSMRTCYCVALTQSIDRWLEDRCAQWVEAILGNSFVILRRHWRELHYMDSYQE